MLREFDGRPGLVFAHEVLAAGGDELRQDPRYRQLVDNLDEPDDDSLMVDVAWRR